MRTDDRHDAVGQRDPAVSIVIPAHNSGELLPRLEAWQEARGRPYDLFTEASVDLARLAGLNPVGVLCEIIDDDGTTTTADDTTTTESPATTDPSTPAPASTTEPSSTKGSASGEEAR